MFDPGPPSWIAGSLTALYGILRIIDRRMKQSSPGSVEYLAERVERIGEKLESLIVSNRHRRQEIEEFSYQLRQLGKRIDANTS